MLGYPQDMNLCGNARIVPRQCLRRAVGEDLPHIGNCNTADPRRTHVIFLPGPVRLCELFPMLIKLSL